MARTKIPGRRNGAARGTEFERAFPDWITREFRDKCLAYEKARKEVIRHNGGKMLGWDAKPPKGAPGGFMEAFNRMEELEQEVAGRLRPLDHMAGHQPSLRTLGGDYALSKYQLGIAKIISESRAFAAEKTAGAHALRRNAELQARIETLEEQLRQKQDSEEKRLREDSIAKARLQRISASLRRVGRPVARKG
ncbi:hypothetical protein HY095_01695 [Candidatus Micrarchaeota archaeon]|nr:hypothetical protein [Candidatus Micrarchaeota archaeon]